MQQRNFETNSNPILEEVINSLENITNVEESREAAQMLGHFLESVDTSNMTRLEKAEIEGIRNHCRKTDAEIDNPDRYIIFLKKYFKKEEEDNKSEMT